MSEPTNQNHTSGTAPRIADVMITFLCSDRGINYASRVLTLLEQHMDITRADIGHDRSSGNQECTVTGTTMLSLADLSSAIYNTPDAPKIMRKLSYTRPRDNIASMLGDVRDVPVFPIQDDDNDD